MIILNREFYKYLLKWKSSSERKPMLLQGARQVGKTFLLEYFAKQEFSDFLYINFEDESDLANTIQNAPNTQSILDYLSIYANRSLNFNSMLIIFDEIQAVPRLISALKYFYEKHSDSYIIATGSLLGVSLFENERSNFPVGKVDLQFLYPLFFFEFLESINEHGLLNLLLNKSDFSPIPDAFHNKLIELLRKYFIVGGMPEVVKSFVEYPDNWSKIRKIQTDILNGYLIDAVRYANKTDSIKIREIWNSIPKQISHENRRFKLTDIKKNASIREYSTALHWLETAGIIIKCNKLSSFRLPLSVYKEESLFKIFLLDVGLLSALLDLSLKTFVNDNDFFLIYKGAFTENYIAQELITQFHKSLYYWQENTSEIDFIISYENEIIPIEIKSGFNTKAKSLKVYLEKYNPKYAIRSSLRNFNCNNNLYDIPLYGLALFPKLLDAVNKGKGVKS